MTGRFIVANKKKRVTSSDRPQTRHQWLAPRTIIIIYYSHARSHTHARAVGRPMHDFVRKKREDYFVLCDWLDRVSHCTWQPSASILNYFLLVRFIEYTFYVHFDDNQMKQDTYAPVHVAFVFVRN